MQEIQLKLTIDEANLVLEALGRLPFEKVFALIGRIQEQAGQQLKAEASTEDQNANGQDSPVAVPSVEG